MCIRDSYIVLQIDSTGRLSFICDKYSSYCVHAVICCPQSSAATIVPICKNTKQHRHMDELETLSTGNISSTQSVSFQDDLYQLNVCGSYSLIGFRQVYHGDNRQQLSNIQHPTLKSAFQNFEESRTKQASRVEYLSMIASDILSTLTDSDLDMTVCKLISIQGEHLLLNLVSTSGCQSITSQHSHSVWKKQASALVTEEVSVLPLSQNRFHLRQSPSVSGIILTPHHLRPIRDRGNHLEVLSLLANNCTLQPSSACFHVDMISSLILHDLLSENLLLTMA